MIPAQFGRTASARRRASGGGGGTALFRAAVAAEGDGANSLSLTKPAGIVSGDILFAFSCSDDAAPSGFTGGGTWAQIDTGTATGLSGTRLWQRTAGGSEPTSYTATFASTVDVAAGLLAVSAATATLAAGPTAATGTGTSMAAPSVTGVTGGLLVCIWYVRSDATARAVTAPGSMTKRGDPSGTWATLAVATEALVANGATGTRTATFPVSAAYRAVSFVVAGA
jgi:hypothetical protein